MILETLFPQAPSSTGLTAARVALPSQARGEIGLVSAWLARPAALVPNSRVLDAPADKVDVDECIEIARRYDLAGRTVIPGINDVHNHIDIHPEGRYARELFNGRIVDVLHETRDGWHWGRVLPARRDCRW